MRKLKLPETADLEQIKAEVTNETFTVTVPKLKPKASEPRKIDITEAIASAEKPSSAPVLLKRTCYNRLATKTIYLY